MNASWIEWAMFALMVVAPMVATWVFFVLYVDRKIEYERERRDSRWIGDAVCTAFFFDVKCWQSAKGAAFAVLADGRVYSAPARHAVQASILSRTQLFWRFVSERYGDGLSDESLERRLPDGDMWRFAEDGVVVFVEEIHEKEMRTVLGCDRVPARRVLDEVVEVRGCTNTNGRGVLGRSQIGHQH